jgi:3-oxoacyl-[acyl-carrier protein] reductase
MIDKRVVLITGTSKGIGRELVLHYLAKGFYVIGCSRQMVALDSPNYQHYAVNVSDEKAVKQVFADIKVRHGQLDVLINNAGIASMNHTLMTPLDTVHEVLNTNVVGTFLFCREAAKLMQKRRFGRIVNFTTIAVPLKLSGEAIYAASKAAIKSLTEVMAKELSPWNITVNAIGPTPIETNLIRSVPKEKIASLLQQQAIPRMGEYRDVKNVIDFFIQPESDFITGQVIYLGGG